MTLSSQRSLFNIPDDVVYLNCAFESAKLESVRLAGETALRRNQQPWTINPHEGFFHDAERARALFASLIGCDDDGVAIIGSASYGVAIAAANIPVVPGQTIVVMEGQFPSNVYAWRELAKSRHATMVTVPRPANHDWTASICEYISENTAVVAIANCHWTDGSRVDLVVVGQRARAVGAALVVDATQSLGAYPLALEAVQPDFLIAACYKWLCGPYGMGLMYVAPHYRGGTPIEHNWICRARSEQFDQLVNYTDEYQPGARRYDVGERGCFILLPMAIAALTQLNAWGVPAIADYIAHLTAQVEAGAKTLGLNPVPTHSRVPHMIGIRVSGGVPKEKVAQLQREKIFVSIRGDSIRVSPYLYNTEDDVQRFLEALAR